MVAEAVRIVTLCPEAERNGKGRLILNEAALEALLNSPIIAGLPVAVLSVAGAYRMGKSFLLNFFLRYALKGSDWLTEDGPLGGFSWRRGENPDTQPTQGILVWGEPIVIQLGGKEVALLLMDTQGTFDDENDTTDCAAIFALSGLLSSLQIYNIMHQIQEDHLQYLQLFASYGRMALDHDAGKPFQSLLFLIRDWSHSSFGFAAGTEYLAKKLQPRKTQPKELQELRRDIAAFYESISCCTLPYPGDKVTECEEFRGQVSDIRDKFRAALAELVAKIFDQGLLVVKKINGQTIRARDLIAIFQSYAKVFNSDDMPQASSVLMATADAVAANAKRRAEDFYLEEMRTAAEADPRPYLPDSDLQRLSRELVDKALDVFLDSPKIGSQEYWRTQTGELRNQLSTRLFYQLESENGARRNATEKANRAAARAALDQYKEAAEEGMAPDKADKGFFQDKDLQAIHERLRTAAEAQYAGVALRDSDGGWEREASELRQDILLAYSTNWNRNTDARMQAQEKDRTAAQAAVEYVYRRLREAMDSSGSFMKESELRQVYNRLLGEALDTYRTAAVGGEAGGEDVIRREAELIFLRAKDEQGALK